MVGDDPKDPFRQLGDSYLERTHRFLSPELKTVREGKRKSKDTRAKAEDDEALALLDASANCLRIALDERGKELTSVEFANGLNRLLERGRPVAFLIGGASGLAEGVRQKSDAVWSLSKMTLPHRMAYCFLAEQIYRAGEILRNGPYHK
jgi:23S rRNA (pseudouridine1915-N3)-methyltransferase